MEITRQTSFAELPAFLSIEEFRAFIGIGRSCAYALARRGEIPTVRFGRLLRVPRASLQAYLKQEDATEGVRSG